MIVSRVKLFLCKTDECCRPRGLLDAAITLINRLDFFLIWTQARWKKTTQDCVENGGREFIRSLSDSMIFTSQGDPKTKSVKNRTLVDKLSFNNGVHFLAAENALRPSYQNHHQRSSLVTRPIGKERAHNTDPALGPLSPLNSTDRDESQ